MDTALVPFVFGAVQADWPIGIHTLIEVRSEAHVGDHRELPPFDS
jgi:hypothetical protein